MTQIQVEYLKHLENVRSNMVREAETRRSNLATELETQRHNVAGEQETRRKNLAGEALTGGYNQEIVRHNRAVEAVSRAQLGLESRRIDISQYQAETQRLQAGESVRHNRAVEAESARHNRYGEMISSRQAAIDQYSADTARMRAQTDQFEANFKKALADAQIGMYRSEEELTKAKAFTEEQNALIKQFEAEIAEAKAKHASAAELANIIDKYEHILGAPIEGAVDIFTQLSHTAHEGINTASNFIRSVGSAVGDFARSIKMN